MRSGCFHDPETGHLPCWRRPGQGQPSWQRGVGKSRMQAPADAGAIQDLPRPAVVPATAVDRKRACQTIREWPGRITAAEPPYPGTRSWQKRFGRPTPGDGQRFKGARSCRAETEPLTRHNATAQCRNGARLRHYMQQTAQARPFPKRSQRTNKRYTYYYISFKRKPATLEPNTSLRQRENPSRLFREASAKRHFVQSKKLFYR